jgi:predicted TIM-barrel enzyme
VFSRTEGVCGFFGASSIERLPTEQAITERVRNFKNLKATPKERSDHA